jgi:hypothetical protein
MLESAYPLSRDRLSVLVAVILIVSVLFRFLEFPSLSWQLDVLGSPLEVRLNGTSLLVMLVVALVVTGTQFVLSHHPNAPDRLPRPLFLSWVLPALLSGLAMYLIHLLPSAWLWGAGLLLVGLLVSLAVGAEFIVLSVDDRRYTRARLALNLLAYLLAFSLFYVIYQTRARSLITATATTIAAFMVSLDLLSVADVSVERVAYCAAAVGLVVGECTWALNYWQLSNWAGAFSILLVFYVASGIAHQHLLGRLSSRVLIEFAAVAALALLVLAIASR